MKYICYNIERLAAIVRERLGTTLVVLIISLYVGMAVLISSTASTQTINVNAFGVNIDIRGTMRNGKLDKILKTLRKADRNLPVYIDIDTRGGELRATKDLIDVLQVWKGKVHTHVNRIAASAGATLFLIGDVRTMSKQAYLMFHTCSTSPFKGSCPSRIERWLQDYFSCRLGKARTWVKKHLLTGDNYFNKSRAKAAGMLSRDR